ncbi:hypothetical protein P12x_002021 [Tundrisphaera lichenicola]|uniref:hypothetical protein n=1 Tax=Tundrisphaera lichenicola TaxID=2029860 RepID=UPI003EB8194E
MRISKVLPSWLSIPILLCGAVARSEADDKAQTPVEVHEWSVWVGNPAQPTFNASRVYRNAMPGSVGTSRPKFDGKELEGKFPIAPISLVQFFGQPGKDIDVEVRVKKGAFMAHWPPSVERGGRLQWFKSDLLDAPPADISPSYLTETHWLSGLRDRKPALVLKHESQFERFIAYDTELAMPIPVKLRGGPDEYTIQNLTSRRLLDVAVIAPTDDGFRVGWLDELPAAAPEKEKEPEKPKATDAEKAEAVFQEPDPKKDDEPAPIPPEGDANVKAQVDQQLNRPITVTVTQAPRKEILDFITGQVRVGYDLDDKTIAKADINLTQPSNMNANNIAARDALAELLGGVGLSYRVTDSGKLFITTAARLAEDAGKSGKVIEGPPVKLLMAPARKGDDPSYREATWDSLTRRLKGQGLRDEAARALLDEYAGALFEPGELVVLAHFTREAIDDVTLLDVFPPPEKMVRSALLVVHGIDPRLQDRAKILVKQLGDDSYKIRESAEARLLELGPVSVPSLEDALKDQDVEIAFRAERLLLKLNRPVP